MMHLAQGGAYLINTGAMIMKIIDRLSQADKEKLSVVSVEKEEKYSRREWEEMMGTRRETYHKVRGKVKRK